MVAKWKRTPGYGTDQDLRVFAEALARKRSRFAFPDAFNDLVCRLQKRLVDKHKKLTPEGKALRALRESRVQASDEWDAPTLREIFFCFVREDSTPEPEGTTWPALREAWLKLVSPTGRFPSIDGMVVTLADMTADDYVHSDRLDLDHLSLPQGNPEEE